MATPMMLVEKADQKELERGHLVASFKITQFVWLFLAFLETLIGLRIWLKLIGTNPTNQITSFVYRFTNLFVTPFAGLAETPAATGLLSEVSSIIAIFVYALLAWQLERIIWVAFYRPRESVEGATKKMTD